MGLPTLSYTLTELEAAARLVVRRLRLRLLQEVRELLERRLDELRRLPEVRREVRVGLLEGSEDCLDEISARLRVAAGAREAVRDPSEREHLLRCRRTDDARTTRRRDEAHADGAALTVNLHRDGVGQADLVTPVAAADRNQVQLGGDDASTNRRRNLLGALAAKTDVAVAVANGNVAHETRVLTGARLLLHRHDLHHVILELLRGEEDVHNLELLDGKGVQVDVLNGRDLAVLHKAAELGARDPLLLLALALLSLLSLLAALALLTAEPALEVSLALSFAFVAAHG